MDAIKREYEKIRHFYHIAELISTQSTCLSRQVGAILVKDGIVVATGYNGPARGIKHCTSCVRRQDPNYNPGALLDKCPAVHAEANCIASAARIGTSIVGATLYINTNVPCKACLSQLINAGIGAIFALDGYYDKLSQEIVKQSRLVVCINNKRYIFHELFLEG